VAAERGVLGGIGLAAAAYLTFSAGDASIKLAAGGYSVFQVATTLALAAQLPVLLTTIGRGGLAALIPRSWPLVLLRAGLTSACCLCAWTAFTLLPLADGYAILFVAPMLVTAFSAVLLREPVGWRRWSATGTGFLGVLIMIRPDFATVGTGHLLALAAALLGSLSFIVLKRIGTRELSASILFVLFLGIALVSLPGAIATFRSPTAPDLLVMIAAGLLMGSGQAMLVVATRRAPANLIAPFQYTQMLWAVLLGYLLFGDAPAPVLWVGMAIVVASGLYTLWRETVRGRVPTLGAARGEVTARVARLPVGTPIRV
jgi:drug/metabolite transporter (DMT)-like permease